MTAGRYKVCYNSGGEGRGKRERNTAEKHQIELQKVKKKKKMHSHAKDFSCKTESRWVVGHVVFFSKSAGALPGEFRRFVVASLNNN